MKVWAGRRNPALVLVSRNSRKDIPNVSGMIHADPWSTIIDSSFLDQSNGFRFFGPASRDIA